MFSATRKACIPGSVELHGVEYWVTWWSVGLYGGVLGYMVGSVGLYGWVVVLHSGVLGYMVESVRLNGGECCITWGKLDYMEGSVGLPSDSPIREWLFNTAWEGGGCQKHLVNNPEEMTTPLCVHENIQPPPLYCVKIFNSHPSSYFKYT